MLLATRIATTYHQVIDEAFGYIVLISSTLSKIIFIKLPKKSDMLYVALS
jgi:hypothetical protein